MCGSEDSRYNALCFANLLKLCVRPRDSHMAGRASTNTRALRKKQRQTQTAEATTSNKKVKRQLAYLLKPRAPPTSFNLAMDHQPLSMTHKKLRKRHLRPLNVSCMSTLQFLGREEIFSQRLSPRHISQRSRFLTAFFTPILLETFF